jgi:hypothetical protein
MTTIEINPNRSEDGGEVVWDVEGKVIGDYFCRRCAGTGKFITHTVNGQPKGPGGDCFRCNGKSF